MSKLSRSDFEDLVEGEKGELRVNGFYLHAVQTTKSKLHVVIHDENGETRGTLDEDRFDDFDSLYSSVCQRVNVEKAEGLGDLFG